MQQRFLPLFYKEVLNAWQSIVGHTPGSKNEVENETILNNKFATIAGKSVFYRSRYEAGVKYIKDVITEDGNLMNLMLSNILSALKLTFRSI